MLTTICVPAMTWCLKAVTDKVLLMRSPLLLLTVLLFVGTRPVFSGEMNPAQIIGAVTYSERIALRPGVIVRVILEDDSRADVRADLLAEVTISPETNVPIPFVLEYDGNAIDERNRYAVRAQIRSAEGKLLWTSTEHIGVLTHGNPAKDVQIMVYRIGDRGQKKSPTESPDGTAKVPSLRTKVFTCEGLELVTRTGPGEIALYLPERYVVLSQVRAASGTKYEGDGILFWSKGDEAMLEVDGVRYTDCRRNPAREPWAEAARRGISFRATGNEPGWYLEIVDGRGMLMVTDYGKQRVRIPVPPPIVTDQHRHYHAVTEAHDLRVDIEEQECYDSMSAERFVATVVVWLDGIEYRGCGRIPV
jgi:putative lipoprotein